PHAGSGARSATGALGVGARSVVPRSVSCSSHRSDHQHAVYAAHDAAGRDGPGAAEDDELVYASHAGLHQLESGGRTVPVLVGGKRDWNRPAVGDESYSAGP